MFTQSGASPVDRLLGSIAAASWNDIASQSPSKIKTFIADNIAGLIPGIDKATIEQIKDVPDYLVRRIIAGDSASLLPKAPLKA